VALIELSAVEKAFTIRRRTGALRRERTVVKAVDGIDLSVDAGAMVGYIGPNGAGKSTTVKLLTGILVPSAGSVRVAGLDPSRRRVELARRIGVVFGQRTQLWWDLPLRDSFDLLRHVYAVPPGRHRANVEAFVELLDLGPFLDTPVRQLSLGQRMRATSPPPCFTTRRSSTSTSRPSASTWCRSRASGSSSTPSTPSVASPSSSRRTTSPTSSGCAGSSS
jgi:ABC-2 type transport system ATP-binding protein